MAFMAAPAMAGVDLAAADACIQGRIEAGKPVLECIEAASADCAANGPEASSTAAVCFREVRDGWSAGIKGLLDKVGATGSDDIATIAAIEVKYDILTGLLQCDRMEELAKAVSDQSAEVILRQKSQCEAAASGNAYARLFWRSRDVK
ncbi:hypothetical protein [Thioclava sp. A2]|uniref:hypothetical protein n=1 Tax=Thioclava sp. FCG-A2 TaxID=3080562 RepID=UPI0029552743|nr:hypothetical protein [Thioclava sp. A2]